MICSNKRIDVFNSWDTSHFFNLYLSYGYINIVYVDRDMDQKWPDFIERRLIFFSPLVLLFVLRAQSIGKKKKKKSN